jgi:A/G-specific adenine glycosylase
MNEFPGNIYHWYNKNRRDLPWRETSDPYKIWISEIILQQTRVAQGINYYLRFIEKFPTIESLAAAGEDEVLKLWQGLGYYSRARNLHSAAKMIVHDFQGRFPDTYENILKLKGVGEYTAAAVASIAFGLPYPVADGNIYRLFARYFGISSPIDSANGKNEIHKIALQIMPLQNPGLHNQSLMEFGALQCVPKSPACDICPLLHSCFAAQNRLVDALPVKSKKTKQSVRYFYYYYIEHKILFFWKKESGGISGKVYTSFPCLNRTKNCPKRFF